MTGRLVERNGVFYAVISYKDSLNQFKQKWINTNLEVRGNKKKANIFLEEQLKKFELEGIPFEEQKPIIDNDIIFIDYLYDFVNKKKDLSPITAHTYKSCLKIMKKFFGTKLKLKDVTYKHIEALYEYLRNERGNKNSTVKHYAIILSPALRQAYRDDLIPKNPFEFVPKLKKEKPKMQYYDKEELEALFSITDKTPLALIVRVAAYYGLRRSELLGLKWKAIDFGRKTITIEFKVVKVENQLYQQDKLKTESSFRTLPLLPDIEKLFRQRQQEIEENKKSYGLSYCQIFDDYVFVNDCGYLMLPDYVSHTFHKILKKNNLKHIRFHDLRHSCASLLAAANIPMKNIQEWLGHANYNTTADVYSHLNFSSKLQSANIIAKQLADWKDKTKDARTLENEIAQLNYLIAEKQIMLKAIQANDSGME